MKKAASIVLAISIIISSLFTVSFSAYAQSYADKLKKAGFTDSYISKLTALHNKYPNWEFTAFKTGLTWDKAVAGERSTHSNQVVEKSSDLGEKYYCACADCYKNGSYVIRCSPSCVSASKWAVEYYMDPRNWLDEKHIFEFESTAYNSSHTQSGVEAIISSTWMKNSNITYKTTEGKTKEIKTKYSKVIMDAAKSSGLSAYYIASRIVKEVGASTAKATGVCGTKAPFNGIYNYYSIGANVTAVQGLEWASGFLKTEKKTTLYSSYDSTKKAGTGTKTAVEAGQYMSYIGTYGDYLKVQLYNSSYSVNGKVGYILKADLRTKYFNYSRPWTDPQKSITGGAAYIANNYKNQSTPYLQKFNVNPAGSLYSHEYMTNIDAVSVEAVFAYNAYKKAGELSKAKIFSIPVFENMPADTSAPSSSTSAQSTTSLPVKVSGLKVKSTSVDSISISWSEYTGAEKYYISVKNNTKNSTFSKTVTSASASLRNLTAGNKYTVKVKAYSGGKWSDYSSEISAKAVPAKVKIKYFTSPKKTKLALKWKGISNVSGYQVYYAKDESFKKIVAKKSFNSKTVKYTGKNFTKGRKYYVKVRAYKTVDGKKYYGKWSKVKSVKSK